MYDVYESLLKAYGITSADVCRATGIREQTISNWKRRRNLLSAELAFIIADYFGVSLDYLMRGSNFIPHATIITKESENDVFLKEHPEYKVLFDACQKVKRDDIRFVQKVIERVSR